MVKIGQKFLMISGGLGLTLLLVELGLRIVGFSFPVFDRFDPDLGWSLWPNQQGWIQNEGGHIYLRINRSGLRDVEHSMEKPQNTFRVAILGDSYAEAAQVQLEQAFWYVMGKQLSSCPTLKGQNVEVINFGVEGYGTDQELLTLRKRVWDYSPDVVILQFTPTNDVTDNSRTLSIEKEKPFFFLRDGALEIDASFQHSVQYHVRTSFGMNIYYKSINYSRILQLIRRVKGARRQRRLGAIVQGTTVSGITKFGLADLSFEEPRDPPWKDAWGVTEALIQEMEQEVEQKGVKFLVVTATRAIQVNPDPVLRAKYAAEIGVSDLFYPERRIGALGKRAGFTVVTLAEPFQEYAQRTRTPLHFGSGHWNVDGNRLAGEIIAHEVCGQQSPGGLSAMKNWGPGSQAQ